MAMLDTRVEIGYGKVLFEEAESFRIPASLTQGRTPESVMDNVKTLFGHAIHGDSNTGHLRAPSRFGTLLLVQHQLGNCDVYSAQFRDTMRGPHGNMYDRGAVNFIEPVDERIDHPLVHAHHYRLVPDAVRETPAEPLAQKPLAVAQWLIRFAQNL